MVADSPLCPQRPEGTGEHDDRRLRAVSQVPARGTLHSVERALRALELVAGSGDGITAKAVARRLGCTLSTSYNVLNTLIAAGYLVRLPEARGYGLGYQVADLAEVLWGELSINAGVRTVVAQLHLETQAAAYLAVYRDAEVVVGHVVDSTRYPRLDGVDVGCRQAVHATAWGKVMLAAMPVERRRALLDRTGLPEFTGRTVVDADVLDTALDAVRAAPVTVDIEEYRRGVATIAAPVLLDGAVVAALGASVPVERLTGARGVLEGAVVSYARCAAEARSLSSEKWHDEPARTV